jgi:hypothetical protein
LGVRQVVNEFGWLITKQLHPFTANILPKLMLDDLKVLYITSAIIDDKAAVTRRFCHQ